MTPNNTGIDALTADRVHGVPGGGACFVVPFADLSIADVPTVAGKNASLGEMIRELAPLGVKVPGGFAITAGAFRLHLRHAGIEEWVYGRLDDLQIDDTRALADVAAIIREKIAAAPLPTAVRKQVFEAYRALSRDAAQQWSDAPRVDVAVRSSATAEDLPTASFAGREDNEHGLRALVMCEIPSNVLLATEFAELFDGFSIGSNDLTQLTLGVDRDSEMLAHVFDEHNGAVKGLIEMVVGKAHAQGRTVGICGEAPSNHPDFAAWLAGIGIDSMSLSPDTLAGVARLIARE